MKSLELYIPTPPSVNACYATNFKTKRRFKSKEYSFWTKKAIEALWKQKRIYFTEKRKYILIIEIGQPNDNRRRDAFNYEKAATDFIVQQDIIVDDCFINLGVIRWTKSIEGGLTKLTIYEMEEGETSDDYDISIQRKPNKTT